jgi:hypothetical protein
MKMIDKKNIYNDEAKKKKSVFLHLTEIIGNEPSWIFPLNKERLDVLLNISSEDEVNDFKSVFWYTIQKMKESGVNFFSPGGSDGRRFIYWFNSHFWQQDFKAPAFEKEEFFFKKSFELVKKFCTIPLTLPRGLIAYPRSNELLILGGNALSNLGKEFLFSLYPINLLAFKKFR